jgi:hypothetical protein
VALRRIANLPHVAGAGEREAGTRSCGWLLDPHSMMQLLVVLLIAATLCGPLLTSAAVAQPEDKRELVELILLRAVLERGAFLACSRLDQSKRTAEQLVEGWRLDLADSSTLLRAMGYSDDEIRTLTDRFDIEKAAPKFADLESLGAYCELLGDWRGRWARLQILLPQAELRRLLKR